jgi:hypothetical protein
MRKACDVYFSLDASACILNVNYCNYLLHVMPFTVYCVIVRSVLFFSSCELDLSTSTDFIMISPFLLMVVCLRRCFCLHTIQISSHNSVCTYGSYAKKI